MKRLAVVVLLAAAACGGSSTRTVKGRTVAVKRDPVKPAALKEFESAMRALRLGGPEANQTARARLEKALKRKSKLLADAEKVYLSVVDYQDLKWATAALYRVAQVYDGFAESLVNASTPKGLSADQAEAYRAALDTYVVTIQDKAVELFSAGYTKAIQMQVYDEYTAKIREALGRVASDKFPPEREARSRERTADRSLEPEMVTEVAR